MANKDYIPKRNIRLFDQMMTLRAAYPSASCELRKGTLFWFGKVKPIAIYLFFASIPGWIWICIVGITSCLLIAFWAYRNYTAKIA